MIKLDENELLEIGKTGDFQVFSQYLKTSV